LVLFFRKEQDSSFSEEKEAKRLLFLALYQDAHSAFSVGHRNGYRVGVVSGMVW
jgi:hypothetical protein